MVDVIFIRKKTCFIISAAIIIAVLLGSLFIYGKKNTDILTGEERAWLTAHDGKIRLAPTPHWAPIEFFDENGRYQGMVADYIRSSKTN
jgi:hypothetical protein